MNNYQPALIKNSLAIAQKEWLGVFSQRATVMS